MDGHRLTRMKDNSKNGRDLNFFRRYLFFTYLHFVFSLSVLIRVNPWFPAFLRVSVDPWQV
jgi:hypothetical protein